jgi:hypothetical protein
MTIRQSRVIQLPFLANNNLNSPALAQRQLKDQYFAALSH